jgi:hypothetical protein
VNDKLSCVEHVDSKLKAARVGRADDRHREIIRGAFVRDGAVQRCTLLLRRPSNSSEIATMPAHDLLLTRIRGEFAEMPGLRLTFPQACRLWHLDPSQCLAVLEDLVVEGFVHETADGAYTAVAATRGVPAKATLSSSQRSMPRSSRTA